MADDITCAARDVICKGSIDQLIIGMAECHLNFDVIELVRLRRSKAGSTCAIALYIVQ